jgi:protein SCO1
MQRWAATMQRAALLVLLSSVAIVCGAQQHVAQGIVTGVASDRQSLTVSCDAIPGYMDAMEMRFAVRAPQELTEIKPGMTVRFTMVEDHHALYADSIEISSAADYGAEQMRAGGLTALQSAMDPVMRGKAVLQGQAVPDFALADQAGKTIKLTELRGKVVVLTFGYSRCPFPQYCYRLSNNLSIVEKRFHARAGRDLVLLTIAIDPEHDQGAVLSEYAASFHADPADWHFLTGSLPEIKQVTAMFGLNFWPAEGLLTHSLHTAVLDRDGKLIANIEGNRFTAQQLGDLVGYELERTR